MSDAATAFLAWVLAIVLIVAIVNATHDTSKPNLPPGTERCWDNLGGQPEPC